MDARTSEILDILQEECAEVIQAVSKIRRFGEDSSYMGMSNLTQLEIEVGDMLALVDLLVKEDFLNEWGLNVAKERKLEKLAEWSDIMKEKGDGS